MSPASKLPSSATSIALLVAVWKYSILVWGAHHGSVRIGVGVSTARGARQAAVGAAAHARDELADEAPSLAVLLASRSHADEAADVLNAVQETVEPPRLIGCVAQAIVAGTRMVVVGSSRKSRIDELLALYGERLTVISQNPIQYARHGAIMGPNGHEDLHADVAVAFAATVRYYFSLLTEPQRT